MVCCMNRSDLWKSDFDKRSMSGAETLISNKRLVACISIIEHGTIIYDSGQTSFQSIF